MCWKHETKENKREKNKKVANRKKNKVFLQSDEIPPEYDAGSLINWFAYHMQHSPMICANCKADLSNYDQVAWHGSQHHVLEKSEFPSVATHLLNHLPIGMYCCHGQVHTSLLNASKMRIFPMVCEIVEKLYPLLSWEERRKVPECYTFMWV